MTDQHPIAPPPRPDAGPEVNSADSTAALPQVAQPPGQPQPVTPREQARHLLRALGAVLRWLGPQAGIRGMNPRALVIAAWRWLLPGGPVLLPAAEAPHHATEQGGGRLLALSNSYPLPSWRPLARAVMVALALFVIWAMFARLGASAGRLFAPDHRPTLALAHGKARVQGWREMALTPGSGLEAEDEGESDDHTATLAAAVGVEHRLRHMGLRPPC